MSAHGLILLAALGCARHVPAEDGATAAAESAPRAMATKATEPATLGALPEGVGIAPGQPAPDAAVERADGAPVTLAELYATGPVLLVFYRGGWCPYCNYQVHELATAWPEFQSRGVTPVMISVDRMEEAAKTQASWEIPFPVLSDPDLAAHTAWRVIHHADDAEVRKLAMFGIDVEASSGRAHHDFAIPSMFLVDKGGVVRWAHADPDYKVRPTVEQILSAMDATGAR